MRYKFLGSAGVQVSELSFGCMTFGEGGGAFGASSGVEEAFELMKVCFEHGVNFFDNAEVYGGLDGPSERVMGEAIKIGIDKGIWKRKELVISTKLFGGTMGPNTNPNVKGLSRKHIAEGTLESLKRMQLDYVDLLFCHRPDPSVHIEETVRAMNDLIRRGLIFHWGTSEWSATQLQAAIAVAERLGLEPPVFEQCEYSLIKRNKVERDFAPLYPNLGLTIWSPLAMGALSGKYKKGVPAPPNSRYGKMQAALNDPKQKPMHMMAKSMLARLDKSLEVAERVTPIADELGCSLGQLALAWTMANPNVSTAIVGATSVEQLRENLGALQVVAKLTPEVLKRIEHAAGTTPPWDEITQQILLQRPLQRARL